MKILIVGGTSVIGFNINKFLKKQKIDIDFTYFRNVLHLDHGHYLDITDRDSTLELIKKIKPDIIIHASALANVDLCETDRSLAHMLNVLGVENVVNGAMISKSKIVYISTSAVFDGKKPIYFEDDEVSPVSYYGLTKSKGEEIVKMSGLPYLILRIDQPYCWVEKWQHTNSVIRVIQALRAKQTFKEITDWYSTPTYVPDFVKALEKLILENITGIFHLVGSDYINRYDWSLEVASIFNLDKNLIQPITSDTLNLSAKRTNVNLSNQKIFQKTGIKLCGIKEGIEKMLDEENAENFD